MEVNGSKFINLCVYKLAVKIIYKDLYIYNADGKKRRIFSIEDRGKNYTKRLTRPKRRDDTKTERLADKSTGKITLTRNLLECVALNILKDSSFAGIKSNPNIIF